MKAVVGVDLGGFYKPSVDMLVRFGFAGLHVDFLNVVEPFPSTGWFAPTGYVPPAWDAELFSAGKMVVDQAVSNLCEKDIQASGHVIHGAPADSLIDYAKQTSSELVVLGTTHKSRWTSALLGSVGRTMTIATDMSLLIARNVHPASDGLNVLFATDHSPYADKCVDKFLSWRPSGVRKVHLITAYDIEPWAIDVIASHVPHIDDASSWLRCEYAKRTEATAKKFVDAGFEVHPHVLQGHPNEVLHHAMSAFAGDVLVLGGQGHGFVERLVVGSVALHQAVAEPYSILIVRP